MVLPFLFLGSQTAKPLTVTTKSVFSAYQNTEHVLLPENYKRSFGWTSQVRISVIANTHFGLFRMPELGSTVSADLTLSDFSDHINSKLGARVHDDHPY